jgi:hypothetical protein|tara:strand:- start:3089 stop:3298 length:210 start_codon:yes stop_codon:yes gene_type:complete
MSFDISELDATERAMYDAINAILEGTKEEVTRMESNLDVLWLLFGAYLVFFMQVRWRSLRPAFDRMKLS